MLVWVWDWIVGTLAQSEAASITLRAGLAASASFAVALLVGSRLIAWLNERFREPIVSPSAAINALHANKARTPTMGGLFIIAAILGGGVLFGDLSNAYLIAALVLTLGLGVVGAVDDLTKLLTRVGGMSARQKLVGQIVVATIVAWLVYRVHRDAPGGLDLIAPLCGCRVELGFWFVPLAVLVIVGSANAVNLTDGLDGLAGGCLVFATAGMGLAAYVAGHAELAAHLEVTKIPGAGEIAILAGAMLGALLGFLWFNCHPAQVFMGDTGSLPLGGLLGMLAVVARQELLLVIVGGVFVAEALSVIAQVASYRWRRRRILLCAPLHHHFQLQGWPESRIVVRFWIGSTLCTLIGLVGMKGLSGARQYPTAVGTVSTPDAPQIDASIVSEMLLEGATSGTTTLPMTTPGTAHGKSGGAWR